jgi:pseudouridine-5'-phosphate glycosidase
VIGYGIDEFPAFYSRSSRLAVDVRCDTPGEVAAIVRARDALRLPGGILVTVPVPTENELPANEAEEAIARALAEAETQSITGKAVTPFLLARVSELTGEASLQANVALLLNNARVATAIAAALASEM